MDFMKAINLMNDSDSISIIEINRANIILLDINTTSKGNQAKYYDTKNKLYIKEQFRYQNVLWKDYMVEHLSSIVGSMLNTSIPIIYQDIVKLSNGRYACVSKDFALDKRFVPIAKFEEYKDIAKSCGYSFKVYRCLIDLMMKHNISESDAKEYLNTMIILDFLLCNEDRHYNNFGLLYNEEESKFSICPLFDFGIGLFEHDKKYEGIELESCIRLIDGKPFSEDLFSPVQMLINRDKEGVRVMCKDLQIPNKSLFPSDKAYAYYKYAYNKLMGELDL